MLIAIVAFFRYLLGIKKKQPDVLVVNNWPDWSIFEKTLLMLINIQRKNKGLPPYEVSEMLYEKAGGRLWDSHQGFTLTKIELIGLGWKYVSENLAINQGLPKDVLRGWLLSKKGHRRNIFRKKYKYCGIVRKGATTILIVGY